MFVVLKAGHIFTGRAILTLFLHAIGKRRHGKKIVDRACLNYYCTDKSLLVQPEDWYGAHEYQVMIPLFQGLQSDTFLRANGWMLNFHSHITFPVVSHKLTMMPTRASGMVQKNLEYIFSWGFLEKWLRSVQSRKIKRNPKTNTPGGFIVADEQRLIFFPTPRGPRVFDTFHKRLTF